MPFPVIVKTLAEQKLTAYCKKKSPGHLAHELRVAYEIRGNSVTIFEQRAPWRPEMSEWTSMPVAQVRFDQKTGTWTLYCADRNGKWHRYEGKQPSKDIGDLLSEIDRDPTGIFWG
ncbi:MAG: DUF3024 domain-containing protein [Nitrospirota bacterium]